MFLRVVLIFLGLGSFATINRPGAGGLPAFVIVLVGWAILDRLDDLIMIARAASESGRGGVNALDRSSDVRDVPRNRPVESRRISS
jgi:hypothetical protein